MPPAAVWDWFVGLPTAAERAIAIGIDDRAWLQFFELIYLKTREADGMALFQACRAHSHTMRARRITLDTHYDALHWTHTSHLAYAVGLP